MAFGVFPDRYTYIDFFDYLPSVVTPWVTTGRAADEMCRTTSASANTCVNVPGIGWQLYSYHLATGLATWLDSTQPGIMSQANGAQTGSYMLEAPSFAQQTGATYYASTVQSQGTPMLQASIPAGSDPADNNLSADQSAFPGPSVSNDLVPLDRVYNSGGVNNPANPGDNLVFTVWAPSAAISARTDLAKLYFMGPVGFDQQAESHRGLAGTGSYSLRICGDGKCYLYELTTNGTWIGRYSFRWHDSAQPISWTLITIYITFRMWMDTKGKWQGDRITFATANATYQDNTNTSWPAIFRYEVGLVKTAIDISFARAQLKNGNNDHIYNVPRLQSLPLSDPNTPVRIDIARDCRAKLNVAKFIYQSPGYILDDYINFEQPIMPAPGGGQNPIYVYWSGYLPPGCTWDVEALDQTGGPISTGGPYPSVVTVAADRGSFAQKTFIPAIRQTAIQLKFTLTTDSTMTLTPTITQYEIDCAPTYEAHNPLDIVTIPYYASSPALPSQIIRSVDITPQEADPGAENATIVVEDYTGELDFLENTNMIPIRVYTTYDSSGDVADLFRGYVLTPVGERIRSDGTKDYPNQLCTKWTLQCVGEWARFYEAVVPLRRYWNGQPASSDTPGAPYLASQIVYYALTQVYEPSYVDVPQFPIQVIADDSETSMSEPGTRQADFALEIANDWLGAYLHFDEAAGVKGMWRMLPQKNAPYNNLAQFVLEHPTAIWGDGVPRIPQWVPSYPSTIAENMQVVQDVFVRAGTFSPRLERAEGNCVIVYGGAMGDDAPGAGVQGAGLLTQFAINVGSYNFLNVSPTSPGYPSGASREFYNRIVPIRDYDYKLATQEAVDWKCRRIYDRACFARYYLDFEAPMVLVTDITDPYQQRPRRLHYYDPVTINLYGVVHQFLVVSCSPSYVKDGIQMARYSIVTQENINTIGIVDKFGMMVKRLEMLMGRHFNVQKAHMSRQRQGEGIHNVIQGLPNILSNPIQDLNPSSATFGQFYLSLDYNGLDVAPLS